MTPTYRNFARARAPRRARDLKSFHAACVTMNVPTVEPLPDVRVSLASLPTSALTQALYHLLELSLFSGEKGYRSISIVGGQTITIVDEPSTLASIQASVPALVQDDVEWAVVRVAEGSAGFETVGVVERLTEPLAQQGIPVLYQSTFSTDYCLIPIDRLDEALECLHSHSANGATDAPATMATAAGNGAINLEDLPSLTRGESRVRHNYPLTVMDRASVHVVRLEKSHRQRHTGALLRLLFMPHSDDAPQAITSLTETADEISLIVGEAAWWADYSRSAIGLRHDTTGWVPIRVGDESGTPLEETGVIASQAKVLADANLSILYLSTFYSDFTLVRRADLSAAEQAFQSSGFRVSKQQASG